MLLSRLLCDASLQWLEDTAGGALMALQQGNGLEPDAHCEASLCPAILLHVERELVWQRVVSSAEQVSVPLQGIGRAPQRAVGSERPLTVLC